GWPPRDRGEDLPERARQADDLAQGGGGGGLQPLGHAFSQGHVVQRLIVVQAQQLADPRRVAGGQGLGRGVEVEGGHGGGFRHMTTIWASNGEAARASLLLLILASKKKGRRIAPPAFILVGLTRFRAA